jgi:ElaB/YqjD/DUF883 family membrane-anchored ribosome-binding protein
MDEITTGELHDKLGNMDQIRDIIFETQLRKHNNRFDGIESDLSMLRQEIRDRMDQLKIAVSNELSMAIESLEKKLKSASSLAQQESTEIRSQVVRIHKKFSDSIDSLNQAFDQQSSSARDELSQTRNSLQQTINVFREQIFKELEERFAELKSDKVSKDDMAETLFELAMRLKEAEPLPILASTNNINEQSIAVSLDNGYTLDEATDVSSLAVDY